MFAKRLAEIESRKAAIRKEIEGADEARIKELTDETNKLLAEEEQIRQKTNIRGRLGSPVEAPEKPDTEKEARARELRQQRTITLSTTGLIKPAVAGKNVNDPLGTPVASIIDMVNVSDCMGMSEYQVPYESAYGTAATNAENTDPSASADPTFAYASIKPVTLTTYSEISREVMNQTDANYYDKVIESARIALRKKAAEFILKGDGAGTPVFVGIIRAAAIAAATDVQVATIGADTLRKIALNYGGAENVIGNAVLFLNKLDLIALGDVRGTNEKKAVYEITPDTSNPNVGIIKDGGLSVRYCLTSALTATASATTGDYTMIYGVPKCYEMGIFGDFNVRVSEDYAFKKRMLAILGEVMVGGNVVVANGFVRVKK